MKPSISAQELIDNAETFIDWNMITKQVDEDIAKETKEFMEKQK